MSTSPGFGMTAPTKKAVHVKWAGKTIALGTFPAAEADEKCARAKALTRAWRSTMRPKPTRDWVMTELERLGVRVVSGRLGRKAGEEGEEGDKKGSAAPAPTTSAGVSGGDPSVERSNSIGWGADADLAMMAGGARRSSSLGLSMMDPGRRGSLGSLGPVVGMEGGDPNMPPHRPLAGGAYEASHYSGKGADGAQRRASSLGLGTLGGGLGNMGMSVNPNQHYEMLKLHHMNLLNEIQETTLMMNLYQQQQLQQQQQQLQQQASAEGIGSGDSQMQAMMQQNQAPIQSGMGQMYGANQMDQQQRASLGLGTLPGQMSTMQQQQPHQQQTSSAEPQEESAEAATDALGSSEKRTAEDAETEPDSKRQKTEEDTKEKESADKATPVEFKQEQEEDSVEEQESV